MDINVGSNKRKTEDPSSSIATPAKILEIPEILAIVLKNLDTEGLKSYRRVCLTWSNEISRILRARVVPRYSGSDWTKFGALLDNKGKEQPRLLSPFQEMYARVYKEELHSSNPSPNFDWLQPPFPITRLSLLFSEDEGGQGVPNDPIPFEFEGFMRRVYETGATRPPSDPYLHKCVWVLLQSCSGTLTHLATPYWRLKKEQISELGLSSLHFPQLRALKAVSKQRFHYQYNNQVEEIDFFLRIIGSAPKIKDLELQDLPSAPLVLERASCLKGLEKVVVDASKDHLWSALVKVNAEALKFIHTTGKGRDPENAFFQRFSSSLEHFGIYRGPDEIPGCPFLTHLEFDASGAPVDLKSFPSLRRVTLYGDCLNPGIKHSSRTVGDVDLENLCLPNALQRRAVLGQLLKLFPCARRWKINYQTLKEFCQVVSKKQFAVEKLALSLRCFGRNPCIRSSADSGIIAETDLEVFSALLLLQNLIELELDQNVDNHACGLLDPLKLRPFKVSKIQYGSLPKLQNLRIFAKSHELPQDLTALKHLDIAIEVIVDPCPTSPSWSDSLVFMRNMTLRVAKTEFP